MARAVLVFKDHMIHQANRLAAEQQDVRRHAEMDKREALISMAEKIEPPPLCSRSATVYPWRQPLMR